MKKIILLLLLCFPLGVYAQHKPNNCPTLEEVKSSSFSEDRAYENTYDLIGVNNFSGNTWWLYINAISGRDLSDAIYKANTALTQGKIMAISQYPEYSDNSAKCIYKLTLGDNLERNLTTFMVF